MVTLPGLNTYSPDALAEIERASRPSRAIAASSPILISTNCTRAVTAPGASAWRRTLLDRATTADICQFWSDVADRFGRPLARVRARRRPGRFAGVRQTRRGRVEFEQRRRSADRGRARGRRPRAACAAPISGAESAAAATTAFAFASTSTCARRTPRPDDHHARAISRALLDAGRTWERLAMVRLRPITGDAGLRAQIEELTARFAYRRHLDYTLVEDLRVLRAAVHVRGFTRRPGEINLKLEVGGIRDVELFTHLQQVIHGGTQRERARPLDRRGAAGLGRAPDPRPPRSRPNSNAPTGRCAIGKTALQLAEDRQTHELPEGAASAAARATMARVDAIVSNLLGVGATVPALPASPTRSARG